MKKKILFSILIISVISLLVFSIQQFRQIKSLTSQNLDLVTRMNSPREKSKNVSKNRLGNDWPVLMTKDISGGKLVAYQIDKNPMESLTGGIYAIVLELSSNNFYPLIYLFRSDYYVSEGDYLLFDIIDGERLLAINSQTNKIEEYKFASNYPNFEYIKSINLPKYDIGIIYGVKCEKNICEITSMTAPTETCFMKLNLLTESYSDIKCMTAHATFVPKRI